MTDSGGAAGVVLEGTREQADFKEITVELGDADGRDQALLDTSRTPSPLPLERPRDHRRTATTMAIEALDIAHSGLEDGLSPCRSRRKLEHAELIVDGGKPIKCAFDPQGYSITKTNVWTIKPVTGKDQPKPEFGGGMPWTIRVQLLLDASLLGADKSIKDDAINLLKMMESAPPLVTFKWGSIESPEDGGLLAQHPLRHVPPQRRAGAGHRRPRAHPVRGGQAGPETPTARAIAGMKVHTVTDGDSLPSVALAHTRATATPPAGARSPRRTGSTTR